jgi:hypothetical protein
MASLEGLEPTTYCLEGSRSIQLSYRDRPITLKCNMNVAQGQYVRFTCALFFFRRMSPKMFDVPVNIENNQSDDYRDK